MIGLIHLDNNLFPFSHSRYFLYQISPWWLRRRTPKQISVSCFPSTGSTPPSWKSSYVFVMNPNIADNQVHVFRRFWISSEWQSFFVLTFLKKEEVQQVAVERSQVHGTSEREIWLLLQTPRTSNLVQAFGVIWRTGYNNRWRFFVLVLTKMPTTVVCEVLSFFQKQFTWTCPWDG